MRMDREIKSALTLKPPRITFYGFVTGLPVYLVSGLAIRSGDGLDFEDLDFTAGGNEGAYPNYVPPGEIWVDDALRVFDRISTIFHEIVERNLMVNRGMDYDDAHDIALEREKVFRRELKKRRPTTTDLKLVTEALRPFASEARPTGKPPGMPSRTIGPL